MTTQEKVERIKLIKQLNTMQEELNKKYETEGLTDEILQKQLQINEVRHKENIPDTNETIHKQYVQ